MNKLDTLITQRADKRYKTAQASVSRILADAEGCAVDISVVGSLAKKRFRIHSDVDLLVHGSTPPSRRAMIERMVANHMRGTDIPYDLIFACDISPERVQELLDDSV